MVDPTLPAPTLPAPAQQAPDATLPVVDRRRYAVDRELARGGMGRILAARDNRLGRNVAIKELLHDEPALRARFEREARITARLQHPGIVNLLEAGTSPSGEPFFVMKLVEGASLDVVVRKRSTQAERLALLPSVLAAVDALAYAHARGVIHRDLKPANVLIGDFGETVVIDWGLAKDLRDSEEPALPRRANDAAATAVGEVMGTPAYMPPEQAEGRPATATADVYALGALIYHVVTGGPPFTGHNANEVLDLVIGGSPRPLAEAAPSLPRDLIAIVERAMARDPSVRYPDAGALADDLRRFTTGQLVGAHRYSVGEIVRRFLVRHRVAVSVAVVAIVALAVVAIVTVRRIVAESRRADTQRHLAEQRRERAERAEHAASRRADDLALEQARRAVREDPSMALAWLATLSDQGIDGRARLIAFQAVSAIPSRQLQSATGAGAGELVASPSGGWVATAVSRQLGAVDAGTAGSRDWRIWVDDRPPRDLTTRLPGRPWPMGDGGMLAWDDRTFVLEPRSWQRRDVAILVDGPFWPRGSGFIALDRVRSDVVAFDRVGAELFRHHTTSGTPSVSKDGAFAFADGSSLFWIAVDLTVASIPVPEGASHRFVLSDNGRWTALATSGGALRLGPGGQRMPLPGVQPIFVGNDGRVVLQPPMPRYGSVSDGAVAIDVVDPDGVDHLLHMEPPVALGSVSPDGRLLMAPLRSHARVFDLDLGVEVGRLRGPVDFSGAAWVGPRTVVAQGHDGTLRRWAMPEHKPETLGSYPSVAPDRTVMATVGDSHWIVKTARGDLLGELPHGDLAWAPDSSHAAVLVRADEAAVGPADPPTPELHLLRVRDRAGTVIADIGDASKFALAPRGERVALWNGVGTEIRVRELGAGQSVTCGVGVPVWNHDGRQLMVLGSLHAVSICDPRNGRVTPGPVLDDRARAVAVSAAGRVALGDGWKVLIAEGFGTRWRHLAPMTEVVRDIVFLGEDRLLVTGGNTITLYDLASDRVWPHVLPAPITRVRGGDDRATVTLETGALWLLDASGEAVLLFERGVSVAWPALDDSLRVVVSRGELAAPDDVEAMNEYDRPFVMHILGDDVPREPARFRAWVLQLTGLDRPSR